MGTVPPPFPGAGAAAIGATSPSGEPTVDEAVAFARRVDGELHRIKATLERTTWVNENFITTDTDLLASAAEEAQMEYLARMIPQAARLERVAAPPDVARQIKLLKFSGTLPAPANAAERGELAQISVAIKNTYNAGKYCPKGKTLLTKPKGAKGADKAAAPCFELDELSRTMGKSRSYDELLEAWTGWHSIAPPMKDKYARYVELANKGSREIGFADFGDLWKGRYDMTSAQFEADTDRLWNEVKPLYTELHCYARRRLRDKYGKDKVPAQGPIPAHLLGNMWAQEWSNIYELLEPYKGQASLDVTKKLVDKKYDAVKMAKTAEGFFTSLGLDPLPPSFWERSLFTKPQDREVACHASAVDVGWNDDVRIKMCIEINEEDLATLHHELGHDYYFHYYHRLPALFQDGANDGFHEGIGDTLALSVTPAYLKKLGLLDRVPDNPKAELNFLLKQALSKVAFLPFGKLIDQWRWDVFSGKTPKGAYNQAWWELRRKYQGVAPPVARSESDFDPGAKFHVAANVSYVRYFLANIYQFQFHRALCKAAGHQGPLSTCSIHGSRAAGDKLRAMLALGQSKPWPEAMKAITGDSRADASALLEYFAPLSAWLREQNKGEACGW